MPRLDRAAEICSALGLEFYVGPPRRTGMAAQDADIAGLSPVPLPDLERSTQDLVRLTAAAGGDPIPDDLWPALAAERGVTLPAGLAGAEALTVSAANEDDMPPSARSTAAREVEVAAGADAVNLDEALEKGRVFFRRDWLDRHGIDTTQCVVIGVRGESMEPTLPRRLLDPGRSQPHATPRRGHLRDRHRGWADREAPRQDRPALVVGQRSSRLGAGALAARGRGDRRGQVGITDVRVKGKKNGQGTHR